MPINNLQTNKFKRIKKTLYFLALIFGFTAISQNTYLQCGKLIDTQNGKVLTNQTIIVSGNKILSVENGILLPKNGSDKIIDLKDKTVLPGLTDMHVHIEHESNPKKYMERFTDNEADIAFKSTVYAKATLMAGFTTVRDLGGSGVNIALRRAKNFYSGKIYCHNWRAC